MVAAGDLVIDGAYPDLFYEYIGYKRAMGYDIPHDSQYPLRSLSRFLGTRPKVPGVLDEEAVHEYCARRAGESSGTQRIRMSTCRRFGLYLREAGIPCYVHPEQLAKLEETFLPRIITEEEMTRIIREADSMSPVRRTPSSLKVYPLLLRMLWACGLRIGEALALTVGDVDVESGVITVRKAKGGKTRLVPMSGSLAECCRVYLREMCLDVADGCEWFFPTEGGGKRDRRPTGVLIKKLMLAAGVTTESGKPPRVHDIRHSYAVCALDKMDAGGADARCALPLLATYMGHADIQSTEYYLHFTKRAMQDVLAKMEEPYETVFPEVSHHA